MLNFLNEFQIWLSLIATVLSITSIFLVLYDRWIKLIVVYGFGDGFETLEFFNNSKERIYIHNISLFYSSFKFLTKRRYLLNYQDFEDPIEFLIEPNNMKRIEFRDMYFIKGDKSKNKRLYIIVYFGGNKKKVLKVS